MEETKRRAPWVLFPSPLKRTLPHFHSLPSLIGAEIVPVKSVNHPPGYTLRRRRGCPISLLLPRPDSTSPEAAPSPVPAVQPRRAEWPTLIWNLPGLVVTPERLGQAPQTRPLSPGEGRGRQGVVWTSSTKSPELLRGAGCPCSPPWATTKQEPCDRAGFPLRQQRQGHSRSRAPTSNAPHFPARTLAYSSATVTPRHPLWLPQPRGKLCAPQRAFSTGSTSPAHLHQVIWRVVLPPEVPQLSRFPAFAPTGPPTQILPISKSSSTCGLSDP